MEPVTAREPLKNFTPEEMRRGPEKSVDGEHATRYPMRAAGITLTGMDVTAGIKREPTGPSPLHAHLRALGPEHVAKTPGEGLEGYATYVHDLLEELVTVATSGDAWLPTTEHQAWTDKRGSSFQGIRK
ncbi:hypothetical protein KY327_01430 [Candidatus Woesearchaeota archaeon]|nr:hypothetical protein [Candidatus Woesearchaeota archaeon]